MMVFKRRIYLLLFIAAAFLYRGGRGLDALPRMEKEASSGLPPLSAPAQGLYGVSAGPGGRTVFTDALGRSFVPEGDIRRIVSLSPGVTEILFAIGAGDKTVGITRYCNYPPEAQDRVRVGGFSGATVSTEQISALKPGVVILSADMHGRIIALLDSLSIPSFAVEPRNFSQVYETIAVLGTLTGNDEGAAAVIRGMKEKIALAAERSRGREKPGVFWELADEPLITVGGGTFISEAIALGGGKNIFEELEEQWPLVSAEQVLIRNPDWILTGDDMGGGLEYLFRRPLWRDLPALKNGRAALVNADLLYRYGPRLADAVIAIAGILYP
jgi:iron complex transport system substrate-binding protein